MLFHLFFVIEVGTEAGGEEEGAGHLTPPPDSFYFPFLRIRIYFSIRLSSSSVC